MEEAGAAVVLSPPCVGIECIPHWPDDVRHFIDVEVLLDLWDELILPPAVSRAWIAWLAEHRQVTVRDCRDRARERFNASQAV